MAGLDRSSSTAQPHASSTDRPSGAQVVDPCSEPGGDRKTVLVADDEPNLRLLVSATIASDEFEILEAADGDQAWRLIQERRPAVVLLDVQMPGLTGLELARAIKTEPALAATRVVLLTSKAQEADIQAGLATGADLYLTKPFSPIQLLKAVDHALSGA
jgi:CheY-like chemotaxis protein